MRPWRALVQSGRAHRESAAAHWSLALVAAPLVPSTIGAFDRGPLLCSGPLRETRSCTKGNSFTSHCVPVVAVGSLQARRCSPFGNANPHLELRSSCALSTQCRQVIFGPSSSSATLASLRQAPLRTRANCAASRNGRAQVGSEWHWLGPVDVLRN